MFNVIPAIDLRDGKCVRLYQGDFSMETIYNENPLDTAKEWQDAGAKLIHIVDLDGAREGKIVNYKILEEISKNIDADIEFGGGIRSTDDVSLLKDIGVKYGILGTKAISEETVDKEFISSCNEILAGNIVIGIDAKGSRPAINGWEKTSHLDVINLAKEVELLGIKRIIYTDIATDGAFTGPNFEYTKKILENTDEITITVSGGTASLGHIKQAKELHETRVFGIIVGKALYDKRINLETAILGYQS